MTALPCRLCCVCSQGGSLGELNHAIVLDQFNRLRQGDRWWYERYGILDDATLAEVKSTRFVSAGRLLALYIWTLMFFCPYIGLIP